MINEISKFYRVWQTWLYQAGIQKKIPKRISNITCTCFETYLKLLHGPTWWNLQYSVIGNFHKCSYQYVLIRLNYDNKHFENIAQLWCVLYRLNRCREIQFKIFFKGQTQLVINNELFKSNCVIIFWFIWVHLGQLG